MPDISPDLVRHLGVLSRIDLTDAEVDMFTGQLDAIVDTIQKVSEVASGDIPPTSHPIPLTNVVREDTVGARLTPGQALQNAPDQADGRFRVTAILGEEQ